MKKILLALIFTITTLMTCSLYASESLTCEKKSNGAYICLPSVTSASVQSTVENNDKMIAKIQNNNNIEESNKMWFGFMVGVIVSIVTVFVFGIAFSSGSSGRGYSC